MVNPKQKGKQGEIEACKWLSKKLYNNELFLRPNQNQTFIGCDIVSEPFIFEIKRREALAFGRWWIQISKVHKLLAKYDKLFIPVVMFRVNKGEWEFLISASVIGDDIGYIHLNSSRFLTWAKRYL